MLTYIIEKTADDLLTIKFGADSENDKKVVDAAAQLTDLKDTGKLSGGELMKVNGPASLPVAMVLAHELGHIYGAIACFDPKMKGYVVSIAHGGKYTVGQVIPA